MKILVIQQKMIGDVLVSSILCENLRLKYTNAQIDYLIYDNTKYVIDGAKYINNQILFTEKERNSKIALLQFALKIRKEKYDIIIDCYAKLESQIIVLFSGAKRKVSFKKKHSKLIYTDVVERSNDYDSNLGLIIEQRLALLEPLNVEKKITFPTINVSQNENEFAKKTFQNYGIDDTKKTIMVSIIGSEASKTYPLHYMANLIDVICENRNVNILFNYIPKQIEDAKLVYNYCKPESQSKIYFEVIGKSIREFIALMNACDCIVGNDGGAINMAKALKKPSFVLFSPWIDKKGWALLEDGKTHVSFHLDEIKPHLFKGKTPKQIKTENKKLYLEFKPEFVKESLKEFLTINIDASHS
jgi:heptosyltransferase-2